MRSRYRALLVGNSVFDDDPHELPALKGPRNDLKLLEDVFTDQALGIYDPRDVRSLLDHTKQEIELALEEFYRSGTRGDQLFLYYSGHGLLNERNELYLCARDTQVGLERSTAVSVGLLRSMADDSPSQARVIVLDCCHSGRFKGGGLPESLRGRGLFVLTSSSARELSTDAMTADEPSAFTRHLVSSLRSPEVDVDRDGFVSLNEAYDYLLPRLRGETRQNPQRNFDGATAEVALGRAAAIPVVLPVPQGNELPAVDVSEQTIEHRGVRADEALPDDIVDVWNSGSGKLDWVAQTNADWFDVEQHKGHIVIRYRARPGTNRGSVRVRARGKGGSKTVRILVEVEEERRKPKLVLSTTDVDFGRVHKGAAVPAETVRLVNEGGGDLRPRIVERPPWVEARIQGGEVIVGATAPEIGEFDGRVHVASAGGDAHIRVRLMVEAGPVLKLSARKVNFGTVPKGRAASKKVVVRNAGDGTLTWSLRQRGDFFTAKRSDDTIVVGLASGTVAGSHHGAIIVESNGGEGTIAVSARVKLAASPARAAAPKSAPKSAPASRPAATAFGPGRWSVRATGMGLAMEMLLDFAPSGQLSGQVGVNLFGASGTEPMAGNWGYDVRSRTLQLSLGPILMGVPLFTSVHAVRLAATPQGELAGTGADGTHYVFRRA